MNELAHVLDAFFKNLIEQKYEENDEYDKYAHQIIERLFWHRTLSFATGLFLKYCNRKNNALQNFFRRYALEHKENEEFYYNKTLELYTLFKNNGIPFYPLKGPFWASIIYGEFGWRHIGDLDIIIPNNKTRQVFGIMNSLNMKVINEPSVDINNVEECMRRRAELSFTSNGQKEFIADIHIELVTGTRHRKAYTIDLEPFWDSKKSHSWGDIEFSAPSLEEWLLYLILHGACQHQFNRFIEILDIIHFLDKYFDDIDWDKIAALSQKWKMDKALYHSLNIINIFKSPAYKIPAQLKKPGLFSRFAASFLGKQDILFASKKYGRYSRKLFRIGTV